MTLGSPLRTPGGGLATGALLPALDEQAQLLADLVEVMTRDIPSLDHILGIVERRLSVTCGMTAGTVRPLRTSRPPMTSGMSTCSAAISASRACRLARSALPGA